MAQGLNRPEDVTKRDVIIGIACVVLLTAGALIGLWLTLRSGDHRGHEDAMTRLAGLRFSPRGAGL